MFIHRYFIPRRWQAWAQTIRIKTKPGQGFLRAPRQLEPALGRVATAIARGLS